MNSTVLYSSTYTEMPEEEIIITGILEQISNTLRKSHVTPNLRETTHQVLPPEEILSDPDFNPALLEKLKQDQKLQRLEGMLKGSRNFVFSQEKRNAAPYSPPERMELFLKNLRMTLPSLYARKEAPKGPATRAAKATESLAPIEYVENPASLDEVGFLDQLCLRGALSDLILGDTAKLDPVNGDAACQLRAPFIVSARAETLIFLAKLKRASGQNPDQIYELVRAFCAANGLHNHNGPISPVQILRLRWQPESPQLSDIFKNLLAHLQAAVNTAIGAFDTTSFLMLAKALTLTQAAETDNFGLPVARHNITLYRDSRELDKRKAALGVMTRDYILGLAGNLAGNQSQPLGKALLASLNASAAYLPLGKGQNLPCLPMYAGLRLALLAEEIQGRPLVVYLKRIGFQRMSPAFTAFDQETRYSLNGAEVFCFLPKSGGGYALAENPESALAGNPALCIDAWSMVDLDGAALAQDMSPVERDLYSPDFQTYCKAFLKTDILGLILAASSAHAPLPTIGRAPEYPEGWADNGRAYAHELLRKASGTSVGKPAAIMENIFNGLTPVADSLAEEYEGFMAYLHSRNQFELIYSQPEPVKDPGSKTTVQRRIKRNVPFTPVHIHAASLAAKQAECRALKESLESRRVNFSNARTPEVIPRAPEVIH